MTQRNGLLAITPLLLLILLFIAYGFLAEVTEMRMVYIFGIVSLFALIAMRGVPTAERISSFWKGATHRDLQVMVWIFILAGIFSSTAKGMGAVDATVNLTLQLLPSNLILAGMFIAACFISLSMGTSVGTIVALVPVATGITEHTYLSLPLIVAAVVGGALFGDNLSFISDTTVVATQTQGCRMKDKFRVNSLIVAPAVFVVLAIYAVMGWNCAAPAHVGEVSYVRVIPYLAVLVTAICGLNVMAVLVTGILLCGIIGMAGGDYGFYGWLDAMGKGIVGMGELIIIAMMAGGMLEIIRANGGIDYIIKRLTRHVTGKRGAEGSIAALVSLVNLCTANNTVAILTVGNIAKKISEQYGVDSRKSASILDTFSCMVQGLLPYGVQMLLAAGLAHVGPMQIIPYLYYPMAIGVVSIGAIVLRLPKRFS